MFISHYGDTSILSLVMFKGGAMKILPYLQGGCVEREMSGLFLRDLFEKEIIYIT